MKTLVTLALLTLICSLRSSSAGPVAPGLLHKDGCCKQITQMNIPKAKVKHVATAPSDCPTNKKAIVVTTVCDVKICIDPSQPAAANLLADFERSTANNTSPSAPFSLSKCERKSKKV